MKELLSFCSDWFCCSWNVDARQKWFDQCWTHRLLSALVSFGIQRNQILSTSSSLYCASAQESSYMM